MNTSSPTRRQQSGRFTLSMALFSCLLAPHFVEAQGYKHVAVAPEDAQQQQLPNAQATGVFSHASMVAIRAEAGSQSTDGITQSLVVDNLEASPVAFIGPNAEQWDLQVIDPDGVAVIDERRNGQMRVAPVRVGSESFPGKQWQLDAKKTGRWQITLRPSGQQALQATERKSAEVLGYLMAKGDPNYKLYSYRDTQMTLQGERVNLVAYLVESGQDRGKRAAMTRKPALPASITRATVTLTAPDNSEQTLILNDAGINGDAVAGDGHYSVALPTHQLGVYTQSVRVEGVRPDGLAFTRTAADLYPVVARSHDFDKRDARLHIDSDTDARITVPVQRISGTEAVFVAAEVWGTNRRGEPELATWVGGLASVEAGTSGEQLTLHTDSRWLMRKQLQAPFSLRNLRLQHKEFHTPMAVSAEKALLVDSKGERSLNRARSGVLAASGQQVSQDMRAKRVGHGRPSSEPTMAAAGGVLMLVHGYCSSSAWSTSHFSNAVEFKDYNANRSHEAFAQRIRDFGASYPSFGVVAHSQGGAAALHLYARYYSGLDYASGGRLIQSVGTPYQGTALAGNLAVLGQIFGAGCGKNTDLTYSGAANWLATIPSWARSQVDYYTTSFKDRWWAYDYCHLATDLLLDDPEDGTTEKWAGQLSGAVNKGHKTGWCHTSGMRDPAQTRDTSRNSSMSNNAAR